MSRGTRKVLFFCLNEVAVLLFLYLDRAAHSWLSTILLAAMLYMAWSLAFDWLFANGWWPR